MRCTKLVKHKYSRKTWITATLIGVFTDLSFHCWFWTHKCRLGSFSNKKKQKNEIKFIVTLKRRKGKNIIFPLAQFFFHYLLGKMVKSHSILDLFPLSIFKKPRTFQGLYKLLLIPNNFNNHWYLRRI